MTKSALFHLAADLATAQADAYRMSQNPKTPTDKAEAPGSPLRGSQTAKNSDSRPSTGRAVAKGLCLNCSKPRDEHQEDLTCWKDSWTSYEPPTHERKVSEHDLARAEAAASIVKAARVWKRSLGHGSMATHEFLCRAVDTYESLLEAGA